jgi:hypothetical protein
MPVASPPSRVSPSAPPLRAAAYWFFVGFSFGTCVAGAVGAVGGEYLASALGLDRSLVPLAFIFFMISSTSGRPSSGPTRKGEFFAIASFLNRPITVSAVALSQHYPTDPIEDAMPSRASFLL